MNIMNTSSLQSSVVNRVLARGRADHHYVARLAASAADVRAAQTFVSSCLIWN